MILVDSSVWISAWKGKSENLTQKLAGLVEVDGVVINPLIRMELLQGAIDLKHQKELKTLLDPISVQALSDEEWEGAPLFSLQQRQKGLTLTTIDCLIAYHAKILGISLWSLDQVFEKVSGINLYRD